MKLSSKKRHTQQQNQQASDSNAASNYQYSGISMAAPQHSHHQQTNAMGNAGTFYPQDFSQAAPPHQQQNAAPQFPAHQQQQQQYQPQQQPYQPQQQQQQFGDAPAQFFIPGQNFLNENPMLTGMAMQYGSQIMGQGSEMVQQKLDKFVPISKLKFYFSVDNSYVAKKLLLLIFPFHQRQWSSPAQPQPPRANLHSPDLYIPSMAMLTFTLVCGLLAGLDNKFSPEQLGMRASATLFWLAIEVLLLATAMYLASIRCASLGWMDLLALCGYKFVAMILVALATVLVGSTAYYVCLAWLGIAIAFFTIRTMKHKLLMGNDNNYEENLSFGASPAQSEVGGGLPSGSLGVKRRIYFMVAFAVLQPLLIWIHTNGLYNSKPIFKHAF